MNKDMRKCVMKSLLFVLPYIIVEFTNVFLILVDKSISNSIGKTALVVFSSFITLNWAINTLQACMASSHNIVLVRNKLDSKDINTSGLFLELMFSLFTGILIFCFAHNITYIYKLDNDVRNILTTILRLKAIELPLVAVGYIAKNDLKAKGKTKMIFIIIVISSVINIIGDIVSVKMGYNEIGIYLATIISTLINTILLFISSKFKLGRVKKVYVKEMLKYGKDLTFNKIIQRIVNLTYTSIASSFGTTIYTIHCACITVSDTLSEIISGYYSGLLINYSNDIESENKGLLKKVDLIGGYGTLFSIIFLIVMMYPSWLFLAKTVSWNDCNPYIWFYSIEFIMEVASSNYRAYLSANKDTKAIRNVALIGGICVRIPLTLLFRKLGFGLLGLSLLCGIDRIVRLIYLRIYIKIKARKKLLYT